MSSTLVAALHQEERSIIEELRASRPYQRLEGIRSLLALYDIQPSAGLPFPEVTRSSEPERPSAMIHPIGGGSLPTAPAIPMPAPHTAEAMNAAEAMRSGPAPMAAGAEAASEPASVVSSVRAALLGIGKN